MTHWAERMYGGPSSAESSHSISGGAYTWEPKKHRGQPRPIGQIACIVTQGAKGTAAVQWAERTPGGPRSEASSHGPLSIAHAWEAK